MEIGRTELDGLPTFFAEGPGPAQAWLVFRVGAADETLLTRGITRLVAGLATEDVQEGDAAYGHAVGGATSAFELNGTPDQVVGMLHRICEALDAPVDDRLEDVRAKEIRYAGWARPDTLDYLLAKRFGPRGIGLSGQRELGLHHVEADAVAAWRERFFGMRNAALALKNVPPDDVDLPPRPPGERRAQPAPDPLPLPLPAWSDDAADEITVSSVQAGGAAVEAFSAIAVRRLRQRLPGGEDRVAMSSVRLFPGLDHVALRCTASEGFASRVRDALLRELQELETTGPAPDELEPRRPASARLDWVAHHHVMDPDGAHAHESDPPGVDAVRDAARAFLDAAIYAVPPGVGMPPAYHYLPSSSHEAVAGRTYDRVGGGGTLVVGDDGVTVTIGDRRVTVFFDRCEAMALNPGGERDLFGSDGFGARIDPAQWRGAAAAVAAIDARLAGRTVVVRLPGE